jgi:sec-independent protein translocase protein TatC
MNAPLRWACQHQPALLQGLVTTSPMGVFSVLVQICLLGGLALSMPYIVYQWMAFIAPALTRNEKRRLLPLGLAAIGLFVAGCIFSYAYVLPASLMFAMELNRTFGFELIWSAPHYYGLVVWMTLGIGLCFEFPLVILGLIYTGLVSVGTFKKIRRHMLVAILVVGAAIIPGGDPLSLILLAVPMYASYELMLFIGIKLEKRRSLP